MYKHIRADDELIDLVKEYIQVLENESDGKYSQAAALKVALRKVLLK